MLIFYTLRVAQKQQLICPLPVNDIWAQKYEKKRLDILFLLIFCCVNKKSKTD